MRNKENYKKFIGKSVIVIIVCSILFFIAHQVEYNRYQYQFNGKIAALIELIESDYPNLDRNEIIQILNNEESYDNLLKEYGYDIKKDAFISVNDSIYPIYTILEYLILLITSISLMILYNSYNRKNDKEIEGIIQCIEDINHKNYDLHIEELSEDQLSILKNEIYKTTVMLKEQAENSLKDKISVKDSIQDISHQLKTPLTSINIMLDNIIDDPEMDTNTKEYFLNQIKKELTNINFLVQNILKLSKFESNTIQFIKEEVSLEDIVNASVSNVSSLCDLRGIEILIENKCDGKINCDYRWQVEAVTNILKNAVEYSNQSGKVIVRCTENNIYSQIEIIDFGIGMNEKDVANLFKRFYKGKDASKDSVGIGLALSKVIIENDNGKIVVDSEVGKGTRFVIKYFYSY